MSDPKKSKEEMTEEYKKALEEKRLKQAREREQKLYRERQEQKSLAKARREAEAKKKELKIAKIEKGIAECNIEIRKAEKALENSRLYDLIGAITLHISLTLLVLTMLIATFELITRRGFLIMLLASWMIICVSIFFQSKTAFTENRYRKNIAKKTTLKKELYETKNHR